jgi:SNF2 family DNA or RNA helicase
MTLHDLPPTVGSWVRKLDDPHNIGRVIGLLEDGSGWRIEVDWGPRGNEFLSVNQVGSGLMPDFVVQDEPLSATRNTLGPGRILTVRRIAECDQALVQLEGDGRLLWLPYQTLKRIKEPALEFLRAEMANADAGERWALRMIAHALRSWNEATGALDRLDVDPLPHQIQLVHRILMSGHTNWLIADDVGLGKTIEVGLILAALERQGRARRILIVTPAGLTRQWQDEMRIKFDRIFEIYESDFSVDDTWKWKLHDRVIASLDLVKPRSVDDEGAEPTTHFGRLLASDNWDLVVFDEAHRLSRTDDGSQTLRFRLARVLRSRTDAMLLLTGTPHQGDTGRFRSLLQLVRPDLERAVRDLEFHPEIVSDIIVRNRKIDVTDLDGNFIFRGHRVLRYPVEPTETMRRLDRELRIYLRRSYGASARIGGSEGRAIGFVMTIYRKLASSSIAALRQALKRRLDRLNGRVVADNSGEIEQIDLELESDTLDTSEIIGVRKPFFDDETAVLQNLITACGPALEDDRKLRVALAAIKQLFQIQGEKVLIFTEYRATQEYLAEWIRQSLGISVAQINGSQSLNEKLENVRAFEGDIPILISTEAGGEGFNLHRGCRFLINYDLPWNPARLIQRIGRLYRYGQTRPVTVLNLHAEDTIDNHILNLALTRVDTIVNEMAPLGPEFSDRYRAEILGELLDQLDLSTILNGDIDASPSFTRDQIDQAIERAKRARALQDQIFQYAESFDPDQISKLACCRVRETYRRIHWNRS